MQTREEAERRDYFRIDDRVLLEYRVVSRQAVTEHPAAQYFAPSHTFDLMRELRLLELEQSLPRSSADYPREAESSLRLLHRKIDLVATTLVAMAQDRPQVEPLPVILSEGGIAFPLSEPLQPGTLIALQLQLLPEWLGLRLYGEVVHDEPLAEAPWMSQRAGPHAAVRFLNLRETDRQLLARHILKSQIQARRQRQQTGQEVN